MIIDDKVADSILHQISHLKRQFQYVPEVILNAPYDGIRNGEKITIKGSLDMAMKRLDTLSEYIKMGLND